MYTYEEKVITAKAKKYCDVCGTEIRIGMACSAAVCEYCERDLCEKCIGYEEDTGGDYRTVWCKSCWDIGKDYRKQMDSLNKTIESLQKKWQKEALEKIEKEKK